MKIEIDNKYIKWVKNHTKESGEADGTEDWTEFLTDYINQVLAAHKESWENLEK